MHSVKWSPSLQPLNKICKSYKSKSSVLSAADWVNEWAEGWVSDVWITCIVSDWQAVSCECLKVCAHRQQLATGVPFAKQPSINACAILPVSGSSAALAAGGEVGRHVSLSGFLLLAAFIENEYVHITSMAMCVCWGECVHLGCRQRFVAAGFSCSVNRPVHKLLQEAKERLACSLGGSL